MIEIVRNAGGVEGLHVALNCFTEAEEERIFRAIGSDHAMMGVGDKQRRWGASGPTHPTFPEEDFYRLLNVVRDSGLWNNGPLVPPDYCLPLVYPVGASFRAHFDSAYRWGEVVIGVTLGQQARMRFYSGRKPREPATVVLPRRSIYVMSGPSRYDFKHGILQQKLSDFGDDKRISWNPNNLRKSLTFRSTKVFSDVCLEEWTRKDPTNAALEARRKAQLQYKARDDISQPSRAAALQLLRQMEGGTLPVQSRFGQPAAATARLSAAAVGSAVSAAIGAVFRGEGRKLGSAGDDYDADVQRAMNASLRSLAQERAKRKRGEGGSPTSVVSADAPKRARKGADGAGVIDLLDSDDGEEEEEREGKGRAKGTKGEEVVVIDD
ncbi:hypothetical protein ACHAXT_006002 [Thalassiosira profunda]